MKTCSVISIAFVFSFAASTFATSPNDVLNVWKENYSNFDHIPLEISFTERLIKAYSKADPNFAKKFSYLVMNHRIQQGDKFFATVLTQRTPSEEPFTTETSYDGEVQKIYYPALKEGQIFSGRSASGIEANTLKDYLQAFPGSLMEQILSKYKKDPNYVLSECDPNTVNGVACEGFKLFKAGEEIPKFELWVAPDKGMIPILLKRFDSAGNLISKLEVFEVKQSNGLWYAKKARRSLIGPKMLVYEIEVEKFVFKPEIDPNIFNLKFPEGTRVIDMLKRKSYKVGAGHKK